ncbi:hypothetical protein GCM10009801_45840 [Streptomyces albiaxialis]|uniref:Uncharacterized protein n=1 Tax=Streptomyces albiaxialis TaxID=329523 RepID=A0ABN2W762_9ACTN
MDADSSPGEWTDPRYADMVAEMEDHADMAEHGPRRRPERVWRGDWFPKCPCGGRPAFIYRKNGGERVLCCDCVTGC